MPSAIDTAREDPLVGFHFALDVQGQITGYFTECSGIGSESEIAEQKVVKDGIQVVLKIPAECNQPVSRIHQKSLQPIHLHQILLHSLISKLQQSKEPSPAIQYLPPEHKHQHPAQVLCKTFRQSEI